MITETFVLDPRYPEVREHIIGKYADGKSVIWAGELWDRYWATADAQGNLPKTMLCDGCHPGTEGYRVWGEILKTYLKRYCKR